MANCIKYQNLSLDEKRQMIGRITHLIQNDEWTFDQVVQLIRLGDAVGKLEKVKILCGIIHPYQN